MGLTIQKRMFNKVKNGDVICLKTGDVFEVRNEKLQV